MKLCNIALYMREMYKKAKHKIPFLERESMGKPKRIFVDMDGTLAEFEYVSDETLFSEGYFLNLKPQNEVVAAIKDLMKRGYQVMIVSSFLEKSKYALREKEMWKDKVLPDIDAIFVPCGISKADAIYQVTGEPLTKKDYLLDDYTPQLVEFERKGGTGLKLLNGINDTTGRWKGFKINKNSCLAELNVLFDEAEGAI